MQEPEDIVPTCAQVTAYSGDICRDELLSLQTCFSDGVASPPSALNIPSSIDQEIGENIIMSLANGLSILHPSQQCREAIMSLLCISVFNLCDHNDTLLTIPREYCLHIRDNVCDQVWHKAVDFQFPLPVCEDLPNATVTLECIGMYISYRIIAELQVLCIQNRQGCINIKPIPRIFEGGL